jgi:dienelactone hydrolase
VSFHGGLDTPTPQDAQNIKSKVLVLHGADDPFVPPKDVDAFHQEMRSAGVDYVFVAYGGAVHSFTDQSAGVNKTSGAAYDARADRRSWSAMRSFLLELFGF